MKDLTHKMAQFFGGENFAERGDDARLELTPAELRKISNLMTENARLKAKLKKLTSDEQNDHLPRCNEWMFQTVKCSSYLKKVKDGKYIGKCDVDGKWFYCDSNHPDNDLIIPDEDWEDPSAGIKKTYFEDTKKTFYGVVIGMKMVIIKANLFMSHYEIDEGYHTDEYDYVDKHITEQVKCLVVAFGCNRTRLVPIDSAQVES